MSIETVDDLLGYWKRQANMCREDAARLGDSLPGVTRELTRDAAQYEQCIHQLEQVIKRDIVLKAIAILKTMPTEGPFVFNEDLHQTMIQLKAVGK